MASNADLNKANRAKKDEFYTQLTDIEKEMHHYGKVSQENYVELTAASAIPNKEIKSPQILRY